MHNKQRNEKDLGNCKNGPNTPKGQTILILFHILTTIAAILGHAKIQTCHTQLA